MAALECLRGIIGDFSDFLRPDGQKVHRFYVFY